MLSDAVVVRKMKISLLFLVTNVLGNFVAGERDKGHFNEHRCCKGRHDDELMSPFWLLPFLLFFPFTLF